MRIPCSKSLTAWIAGGLILGAHVMFQRVEAQRLGIGFINNGRNIDGSRLEFRTPEGYSCRYTDSDRPSVTGGIGVADPLVVPGSYSYNETFPARVQDPQPVGGIVLKIPLGNKPKNCDEILRLEANNITLLKAQELFEYGLIEENEMNAIADEVYKNLLRTVKNNAN